MVIGYNIYCKNVNVSSDDDMYNSYNRDEIPLLSHKAILVDWSYIWICWVYDSNVLDLPSSEVALRTIRESTVFLLYRLLEFLLCTRICCLFWSNFPFFRTHVAIIGDFCLLLYQYLCFNNSASSW